MAISSIRHISATSSTWDDVRGKMKEAIAFREVLTNLTRKELKVRYKNSALGFLWSMFNPLLYLVVFYAVFNVFLPATVPDYHVYLLAGLLPWTFLLTSLSDATISVVSSPDLVKKVYFPREMLPLSAIAARMIHFFLQFLVLVVFLLVTGYPFVSAGLALVPLALMTELLLLAGLGFLLSAANVQARDTQYLLELALLALFWMTPIVYPSALAAERMAGYSLAGIPLTDVYLANPVTRVIMGFQRAIYGDPRGAGGTADGVLIDQPLTWYLQGIGYAAIVGFALLALGWWTFHRLDFRFAEEL